jgi:hypothetical protein
MEGGYNHLERGNEMKTSKEEPEQEKTTPALNSDHEEDIRKRIEVVADTIREFEDVYVKTRKTVKERLTEIVNIGLKQYKMEPMHLRDLIDRTFAESGVNMSYLRKLLPDILKHTPKGRLDYKHKRELRQQERQQSQFYPQELPPETYMQRTTSNAEVGEQESIEGAEKEELKIYEEMKRLQDKVAELGEPFSAMAILQLGRRDIQIIAKIDPLKKEISSVEAISLDF